MQSLAAACWLMNSCRLDNDNHDERPQTEEPQTTSSSSSSSGEEEGSSSSSSSSDSGVRQQQFTSWRFRVLAVLSRKGLVESVGKVRKGSEVGL